MIAARCSCGFTWTHAALVFASIPAVVDMVRHWSSGHDVACARDVRPEGADTMTCARALDNEDTKRICDFMAVCYEAWGNDKIHYRLWSKLNLGILMWIWRRTVLDQQRTGVKRWVKLDRAQFVKCLMALAADPLYVEWLRGRNMSDRDRPPTYGRIKAIFVRRLGEMGMRQVRFPQEEWVK